MSNKTSEKITIFFKAGYDGKCFGACYQSQRVLMLAKLKLNEHIIPSFKTIAVNISRPPESFKKLGLRLRVPALYMDASPDIEPVDVPDDIVTVLESQYPGGLLKNDLVNEAEAATR
uniref:CLIC N-terminal domain-containing protein n=1 Tax=Clastoptera arizonana TaxID=38151 RepID=A0A1B6C4P8_9HEMI